MLEINYEHGQLSLNVKYRYQLHLFDGVYQYCGLNSLQIRSIKYDKYEKYVCNSSRKAIHKTKSVNMHLNMNKSKSVMSEQEDEVKE